MKKTKLIIVRHGQSMGNLVDKFLGHTDLDLTEKGYLQASLVADYLDGIEIDKIYASDLKRAYNTVVETAKRKGIEIIPEKGLREIFAGDWENMGFDDLKNTYVEDYSVWLNDLGNARCTNGESVAELQERVCSTLAEIAENNPGKTVLIGTHATPIRVFYAKWNGFSLDEIKNIPWAPNASVTVAEYEDGKFVVGEYGKNDYLGAEATALPKNV